MKYITTEIKIFIEKYLTENILIDSNSHINMSDVLYRIECYFFYNNLVYNRYIIALYVTEVLSNIMGTEVSIVLDSQNIRLSRAIYKGFRWKTKFNKREFRLKYIVDIGKKQPFYQRYYDIVMNYFFKPQ
jgi:hypothetical protein